MSSPMVSPLKKQSDPGWGLLLTRVMASYTIITSGQAKKLLFNSQLNFFSLSITSMIDKRKVTHVIAFIDPSYGYIINYHLCAKQKAFVKLAIKLLL
jgi:hypothetical protein